MQFKNAMFWEMEAITQTEEKKPSLDCDDETYEEWWFEMNHHYNWFLVRMEQWLGGPDGFTPTGQRMYDDCIEAQIIGKRSYYWNKISKRLFLEMKDGFESWKRTVNKNEQKWVQYKTREMKKRELEEMNTLYY